MISNITKNLDYPTKLDSYYYDKNRCTTILILKVRYKRATLHVPINKIMQDKESLSNMHPIDLCIIGVLSNISLIQPENNINNFGNVSDEFLMMKMQHTLEIIGRDYTEVDEAITLRLVPLNKIITIPAVELYNNKKLITALKYHDAISLGYSISNPNEFLKENVLRTGNFYDTYLCFFKGLFFGSLLLSTLLLSREVAFEFFGIQYLIKGEILLLPLIFLLKYFTIKMRSVENESMFFSIEIWALIIFVIYFSYITRLPFPLNNSVTKAFNALYYGMTNHPPKYLLCLIITIIIVNHTISYINLNLNVTSHIKDSIINCFYISLFFLISMIFCSVIESDNYSLTDYFYTIMVIIFTTSFSSSLKFPQNKTYT